MEPQPGSTTPDNTNSYDFIVNPEKQKKAGGLALGKDPFITKIIVIVGGAVVLMVIAGVIVSLLFSNKTNTSTFVALAERQQEIVRVSALGSDATSQDVKDAAVNTQVSIQSDQNKLLAYLKAHNRTLAAADLALKKDAATDNKLKQAKADSTFDTTYAGIMQKLLTTYASELKAAYDGKPNSTQRQILALQYQDVQLLLKQWPQTSASQ